MEEKSKIDSLADTLFELMENISGVEESLEKFKGEIKGEIEALKAGQGESKADSTSSGGAQGKKAQGDLTKRFNALESNVNKIVGSGVLEALGKKIDAKMLIKKEIRRYQSMIMLVVLLAVGSGAGFIYYNLSANQSNLIVFGAVMAVLVVALVVINFNLKRALANDKNAKANPRDEIAIESHTLDMPESLMDDESNATTAQMPTAQHRERTIRNTLDE